MRSEGVEVRKEIYALTGNEGKLEEFRDVALEYGFIVKPAGIPKLEIQSDTLDEIASIAAVIGYAQFRKPLFAEDSGLFIKSLRGFPGPYSAYVYKKLGIEGIIKLMEDIEDREACFRSSIAFIPNTGIVKVFRGEVCGEISYRPRGKRGFGFDPIFIPRNHHKTFAEMNVKEKNALSHRGKAFRRMLTWLTQTGF